MKFTENTENNMSYLTGNHGAPQQTVMISTTANQQQAGTTRVGQDGAAAQSRRAVKKVDMLMNGRKNGLGADSSSDEPMSQASIQTGRADIDGSQRSERSLKLGKGRQTRHDSSSSSESEIDDSLSKGRHSKRFKMLQAQQLRLGSLGPTLFGGSAKGNGVDT